MSQATFGVPIKELYGNSKSLDSSTAVYIRFPPKYHETLLYCASDWKLLLNPKIQHVIFYDDSEGTYTSYTTEATDGDSSTHVQLDLMTASDYLYILTNSPIKGLDIDVGNANGTTTTLDMEYYKSDNTWADVSNDSDGTDATFPSGTTLGRDGVYTWDALTSASVIAKDDAVNGLWGLYGIRFSPLATLSATVDINELQTINNATTYANLRAGIEYQFSINNQKVGTLQVLSGSGTPTLYYDWVQH